LWVVVAGLVCAVVRAIAARLPLLLSRLTGRPVVVALRLSIGLLGSTGVVRVPWLLLRVRGAPWRWGLRSALLLWIVPRVLLVLRIIVGPLRITLIGGVVESCEPTRSPCHHSPWCCRSTTHC
jgi:hypothetical protein